jgi:hypothetical protein
LSPNFLRSRKRPARTPPSTFLFLPIHLSNSPEPCGSAPKPAHSTRRREHGHSDHGRMLGHRETVRGFADAPSRQAAARQNELYSLRLPTLSTAGLTKKAPRTGDKTVIRARFLRRGIHTLGPRGDAHRQAFPAPHCGHIPPPLFPQSCRACRKWGWRQHH